MKKITLNEIITYFDSQVPNQYSRENKVEWLSEIDEMIYELIIKDRENSEISSFNGYNADTDDETELLVPAMFKDLYRYYIEKNVYYSNREINAFNNAAQLFEMNYENYFAWYNRNHKTATTAQFQI